MVTEGKFKNTVKNGWKEIFYFVSTTAIYNILCRSNKKIKENVALKALQLFEEIFADQIKKLEHTAAL